MHQPPRELSPAGVLLVLRDCADASQEELRRQFGVSNTRYDLRNSRLTDILRGLVTVGLVEVRAEESLPQSADGSPAHRSLSPAEPVRHYRVSSRLCELQEALGLSLRALADESESPHRDERAELDCLVRVLDRGMPDHGYKKDLIESLRELSICVGARCYIAALALSGKILEIAVKHYLEESGDRVQADMMLGPLLRKLDEHAQYVDPGLKSVASIINASRIPAVHAKRDIPVPSAHQAVLVVRAVLDVVKRFVTGPLGVA